MPGKNSIFLSATRKLKFETLTLGILELGSQYCIRQGCINQFLSWSKFLEQPNAKIDIFLPALLVILSKELENSMKF